MYKVPCVWLLLFLALAPAARAATHTVCSSGCDFEKIAWAIGAAQDGDTLQLSAQIYSEWSLQIHKSLTIQGAGMSSTFIDGLDQDRIFTVWEDHSLVLRDLTLSSGNTLSWGGGLYVEGGGTALVSDVRITDCEAGSGGGIYAEGNLVVERSFIDANHAKYGGGVTLFVDSSRETFALIEESTIGANQADELGGGLYAPAGRARVEATLIHHNVAKLGGGAMTCNFNDPIDIVNSTVSSNGSLTNGGGLYVCEGAQTRLANVTVSRNVADLDDDNSGTGGGVFGSVELTNSIVGENVDEVNGNVFAVNAPDCHGTLTSYGYNIIGSKGSDLLGGTPPCKVVGDPTGVQFPAAPLLGDLADHGGATFTHSLSASSPAIEEGDPFGCRTFQGVLLDVDQRGASRVGRCDIGAFEYGGKIVLFASGFETGDHSEWSSAEP